MRKLILSIAIFSLVYSAFSQQLLNDNHYQVNKFSLSPAFAGFNGNYESFLMYKKYWTGVQDAPEKRMFSLNGPMFRNMGIGATVCNETAGIFNNLQVNVSYAYRFSLSKDHAFSLGLYAGIIDNNIEYFMNSQTEMDPILIQNIENRGAGLDAGFGVNYRWKKLVVGVAIPKLLSPSFDGSQKHPSPVSSAHFRGFAMYNIDITPDFNIEPIVYVSKAPISELYYSISALVKYRDMMWLSASYNASGAIGLGVGATYSRFALSYQYDLGVAGLPTYGGATHEIAIGMLIGKNNESKETLSVFKTATSQPYQNWKK